jgi:hypothetical protein
VISFSTRKSHDKTSYSAYRSSLFCGLGCRAAPSGGNASDAYAGANSTDDISRADNRAEHYHAHRAGTGSERRTGSYESCDDAANQPDRAADADHD